MCGRFTLTYDDVDAIAESLGVPRDSLTMFRPRYNIAPTDTHLVVRMRNEDRDALEAKWGLINSWTKDPKQAFKNINARAETIDTSPAFRNAFEKRRCVVPADGFFEWEGPRNRRQPYWYHRPDGRLILFAGLYEWRKVDGDWQATFTIVTTDANRLIAPVHDRMPVILDGDAVDEWIFPNNPNPAELKRLLVPAPDDLLVPRRVSPRVNDVKNDDPSLLEEVRPAGLL